MRPGTGIPLLIAAIVALVGFVAFIAIELRVSEPVVPLRHFANRTILVCIVLSTVIGVGLFSVVSYVPTYIQMAYGTTATVSGLVPIATVFGMLVEHPRDRVARQPLGPVPRASRSSAPPLRPRSGCS